MNFRSKLLKGYLCSLVVGLGVAVAASAADDWPTRWQVNGNGETGALEFTIDGGGSVTGRLLGESVEGFVSGRHLVIHRDAGDRTELWEGWLSSVVPDSSQIVAGSISIEENGTTRVYPWFGTQGATVDPAVPPPVVAVPAPADPPPPSATEKPAESAAAAPDGGPLAGTWVSLTGERIEIGQDGSRLTVITPDGSSHSGRVTGDSSLVVGLRKGCCNGTLESPDVIVWSDGARWQRTDQNRP